MSCTSDTIAERTTVPRLPEHPTDYVALLSHNASAPPLATRREWIGLAVLALPCLLYSMDLTVPHLAVPKLTEDLGEVFALLGPNGAGKTTVVQILSTLIPADAGTAGVMGHDVRREAGAVRAAIGVTGQFSAVDPLLTGEENRRSESQSNETACPSRLTNLLTCSSNGRVD